VMVLCGFKLWVLGGDPLLAHANMQLGGVCHITAWAVGCLFESLECGLEITGVESLYSVIESPALEFGRRERRRRVLRCLHGERPIRIFYCYYERTGSQA